MTRWQQSGKKFLNLTLKVVAGVWWVLQIFWLGLCLFFNLFKPLKKYFQERKLAVFLLIILLFSSFITVSAIFPSPNKFEVNLIVQQMSFTYAGNESNQLFLTRIPRVDEVSVTGSPTFSLSGSFQSDSNPSLNRQGTLTFEPYHASSQLIITPLNPQESSELEVRELRIQPQTEVANLTYNPFGSTLEFSLQPDPQLKASNTLKLYLGTKPLRVTLEGYRLPALGLRNSSNQATSLEFILEPDSPELNLFLEKQARLYCDLPALTQINTEEWFWKRLNVQNTKFFRLIQTGLVSDEEVQISTIIEGKIRMAGQELKIEPNQFLIAGKPGIQLLRDIQILPVQGLSVRGAGESRRIQIGLDPNFPVASIQAGWLAQFFSPEAISAIISFCTSVVVALLSWLIDDFAQSRS
jgi:hypothetical protein